MKKYINILVGLLIAIAINAVFMLIAFMLDFDSDSSGMALVYLFGFPISLFVSSYIVGSRDKELGYNFKNAIIRTPGLYFSLFYIFMVSLTSRGDSISDLLPVLPLSLVPIIISVFIYRSAFKKIF